MPWQHLLVTARAFRFHSGSRHSSAGHAIRLCPTGGAGRILWARGCFFGKTAQIARFPTVNHRKSRDLRWLFNAVPFCPPFSACFASPLRALCVNPKKPPQNSVFSPRINHLKTTCTTNKPRKASSTAKPARPLTCSGSLWKRPHSTMNG